MNLALGHYSKITFVWFETVGHSWCNFDVLGLYDD